MLLFKVGDYISEAPIVEILPKKVIMEEEDGMKYELFINGSIKTGKMEACTDVRDYSGIAGFKDGLKEEVICSVQGGKKWILKR